MRATKACAMAPPQSRLLPPRRNATTSSPMRWTVGIVVVLIALLAAYTVWPLVALYRLATAVETRNVAAVVRMIELRPLRLSLIQQLIAECFRITGTARLGPLGTNVAATLGATIADPIVDHLLKVDNLIVLLAEGSADVAGAPRISLDFPPLTARSLTSAWRTWLSSDYAGTRFRVSLPPDKPTAQQFGIRLHVSNWRWKLTGLTLPESLLRRLAEEIVKKHPPP
jgi:Protein of unknown function (DUF2939)